MWTPQEGAPGVQRVIGDARVLHYACCGFEQMREKYRRLGAFGDLWFGKFDIRHSIGNFHLDARDMIAGNDDALSRAFYRNGAMLDDCDEIGNCWTPGCWCASTRSRTG
jgi:hypothetical protein